MVFLFKIKLKMEERWVYILKWKKYYVWYTWDLEKRLREHRKWTTKTTREIWDWELMRFIECTTKSEAISLERKIKRSKYICSIRVCFYNP